ncbi:folate-binding protein|uniref:CAF17-like 4Fe-4S cluster assembly/insertion protein YgfZ n=1 Tax=Noviherbaspirillum sp. L7-7A TaxID=2850560 RepID=UPI001C2C8765|nr:folate-binding protein [Noviherbaspirillum sp. L7-7A]MBV0878802.1 folate-binding protein [Noviherbaspirillum sp. L7-7A]
MSTSTTPWLEFLAAQGARLSASTSPEVLGFQDEANAANIVVPLTHLGLIAATGEEAASFLHNQLTNDVQSLGSSGARLAGYCTPKGRLLATMLIWKSADAILLQLPREIQAAVQKRLQMFILRAKAKLADVSDSQVALGLAGPDVAAALAPWFPDVPAAAYGVTHQAAGTLIRMPDAGGAARFQWIAPLETAQQAWPQLVRNLRPAATSAWRALDIQAGIPLVVQATQEQFVPQMINFEVLGGVNFRKGCYPGQEIVARSQYLGKLKRRMLPAQVAASGVLAGTEVFASSDPDQPCGQIVNAEAIGDRTLCLVELKTAVLEQGDDIRLGSASGPVLDIGTLPYELIDPT